MNEHRPDAVVEGSEDALGAPILRRRVWAGEPEHRATIYKKGSKGGIVEFFAIVSLKAHDWSTKLCLSKGIELN